MDNLEPYNHMATFGGSSWYPFPGQNSCNFNIIQYINSPSCEITVFPQQYAKPLPNLTELYLSKNESLIISPHINQSMGYTQMSLSIWMQYKIVA
jgi:hypothetical protein